MPPSTKSLYPAELFLPDGSVILKGRVYVEPDGRVRVWDVYQHEPRLRFDSRITLESYEPRGHPVLTGQTPEGKLTVSAIGGCECGGAYVLRRIEGVDP